MPKFVKGVKIVSNYLPLVDIPIGAAIDVHFSKNLAEGQRIDWGSAVKANTAGELAQLGITGGAAAMSSVVLVAGTLAGGTVGFVAGTGADIAATEIAYSRMGFTETSLAGDYFTPKTSNTKTKESLPTFSGSGLGVVSQDFSVVEETAKTSAPTKPIDAFGSTFSWMSDPLGLNKGSMTSKSTGMITSRPSTTAAKTAVTSSSSRKVSTTVQPSVSVQRGTTGGSSGGSSGSSGGSSGSSGGSTTVTRSYGGGHTVTKTTKPRKRR
jgi:hypothetical protein